MKFKFFAFTNKLFEKKRIERKNFCLAKHYFAKNPSNAS